ncbi:MAG: hypothetical protein ABIH37_01920 [archaeon]
MKSKLLIKAQVTIFIIIAIAVILSVIIFFGIKTNIFDFKQENLIKSKDIINKLDSKYWPIYNSVETCIIDLGYDAIEHMGETGGYYEKPPHYLELEKINMTIAYYFKNGNRYMPPKEIIESELNLYMDKNLKNCTSLNLFALFYNFTIKEGIIETKTEINQDDVAFYVNYPIYVYDGDYNFTLRGFQVVLPVRLGSIHDVISIYLGNQAKHGSEECTDCFEDLDLNITIQRIKPERNLSIFFIMDEKSLVKGRDFTVIFANEYV